MMIPLAIAIGIVEDKIANDLTDKKSVKELLEEITDKFRHWKPKTVKVKLVFEKFSLEYEVMKISPVGNFIEIITDDKHILYNADDIRRIEVNDE